MRDAAEGRGPAGFQQACFVLRFPLFPPGGYDRRAADVLRGDREDPGADRRVSGPGIRPAGAVRGGTRGTAGAPGVFGHPGDDPEIRD